MMLPPATWVYLGCGFTDRLVVIGFSSDQSADS